MPLQPGSMLSVICDNSGTSAGPGNGANSAVSAGERDSANSNLNTRRGNISNSAVSTSDRNSAKSNLNTRRGNISNSAVSASERDSANSNLNTRRGNYATREKLRTSRSTRGQGAVELVAALVCLTPVALCLFDLGIVAAGAGLNDAVCRDSARAAASGPPSELTVGTDRTVASDKSPYQRAQHVIKTMYATNIPAKVKDTIAVKETVSDVPPPPVGGAISGEVSVETTVDIYPPFLIGAIIGNSGVTLKAKHIVPITYVVPDTSS